MLFNNVATLALLAAVFGFAEGLKLSTIPASSPLVRWLGRTQTSNGAVFFDWEGVTATIAATNYSFIGVTISDTCAGSSIGGGSRWAVYMNTSNVAVGAPNHRIQTFYSGPMSQFYYLINNPGKGCDPECAFTGVDTYSLVRLSESRLANCGPNGNLSVTSFVTDGTFVAPPAGSARRLEFIGDSISAGDLNSGAGLKTCGNAVFNNDVTLTSGGQLCTALGADCMYTAWGGIRLGSIDPANAFWGMQQLYPYTFSAGGVNAYTNWTFSQSFHPAAVVLNLGTNDRPAPPAAAWIQQYVGFVTSIVQDYYQDPNLIIFAAYGPMTTEYEPFVLNATQTLVANGIKAYPLDLTLNSSMTGCFNHPSAADNAAIAAKISPFISNILGWD